MVNEGHSILVAEDNRVLSDVLRFNLERAGFEVDVAENGRVAIERLQERTFDLLITDHQMPEMDGERLCAAVREELHIEHMPIVMCSAKGLELDASELREKYQVTQVIFKPFSMREIVTLAESLIGTGAIPTGAKLG